jgi:hypothetical protein
MYCCVDPTPSERAIRLGPKKKSLHLPRVHILHTVDRHNHCSRRFLRLPDSATWGGARIVIGAGRAVEETLRVPSSHKGSPLATLPGSCGPESKPGGSRATPGLAGLYRLTQPKTYCTRAHPSPRSSRGCTVRRLHRLPLVPSMAPATNHGERTLAIAEATQQPWRPSQRRDRSQPMSLAVAVGAIISGRHATHRTTEVRTPRTAPGGNGTTAPFLFPRSSREISITHLLAMLSTPSEVILSPSSDAQAVCSRARNHRPRTRARLHS